MISDGPDSGRVGLFEVKARAAGVAARKHEAPEGCGLAWLVGESGLSGGAERAGTRLEGLVGRGVECGLYPKDTGSPERCPAGEQPLDLYFRSSDSHCDARMSVGGEAATPSPQPLVE